MVMYWPDVKCGQKASSRRAYVSMGGHAVGVILQDVLKKAFTNALFLALLNVGNSHYPKTKQPKRLLSV